MSGSDRGIVLVGFMGAGKTTVGRELARQIGCQLADLDELIAQHEGRPIADIINGDGEPHFRALETVALVRVLRAQGSGVIALGGGAWTIPTNREAIATAGWASVWLDTPFEVCWSRIEGSASLRPLAAERSGARLLYDERRAVYQLATHAVPVAVDTPPAALASLILELTGETPGSPH